MLCGVCHIVACGWRRQKEMTRTPRLPYSAGDRITHREKVCAEISQPSPFYLSFFLSFFLFSFPLLVISYVYLSLSPTYIYCYRLIYIYIYSVVYRVRICMWIVEGWMGFQQRWTTL